ncbi:hypothetical protein MHYP_G00069640 [Metynnis hypsauchen]
MKRSIDPPAHSKLKAAGHLSLSRANYMSSALTAAALSHLYTDLNLTPLTGIQNLAEPDHNRDDSAADLCSDPTLGQTLLTASLCHRYSLSMSSLSPLPCLLTTIKFSLPQGNYSKVKESPLIQLRTECCYQAQAHLPVSLKPSPQHQHTITDPTWLIRSTAQTIRHSLHAQQHHYRHKGPDFNIDPSNWNYDVCLEGT